MKIAKLIHFETGCIGGEIMMVLEYKSKGIKQLRLHLTKEMAFIMILSLLKRISKLHRKKQK